jgi:hypothetical protein
MASLLIAATAAAGAGGWGCDDDLGVIITLTLHRPVDAGHKQTYRAQNETRICPVVFVTFYSYEYP